MRRSAYRVEEAEESYFASISDLMVGILFVFLLMLTVFAINFRDAEHAHLVKLEELQKARRELEYQKSIADRAIAVAQQQKAEAQWQAAINAQLKAKLTEAVIMLEKEIESREAARQHLLSDLKNSLAQRGIKVEIDQRSGVLRLSGDLLFATGSATLSGEATRTVRALGDALSAAMPCYAIDPPSGCHSDSAPILETVLIEGHTDHQPVLSTSRFRDNDQLSTERALAVFAELMRAQPKLNDLHNSDNLQLLGVSGYGDRRPLPDAQDMSEESFRRNRRIDIRFVLTSRTSGELRRLRDELQQLVGDK